MQVAAAVLPDTPNSSATRAYDDSLRSEHVNQSSGITIAPETRWQKQWKDMQDKVLTSDPTLLQGMQCGSLHILRTSSTSAQECARPRLM